MVRAADTMKHLSSVPHYHDARPLHEVRASALTPASFYDDYVSKMRPCVIRGAVEHWAAVKRWGSADYLRQAVGNPRVTVMVAPRLEFPKSVSRNPDLAKRVNESYVIRSFEEFLTEACSAKPGHWTIHAAPLLESSEFGALCGDVQGVAFLSRPRPPRRYAHKRVFFYKHSYTDWHIHPVDEVLMCQVVGEKEVLLLPPDQRSWDALMSVVREVGYLYDVDVDTFREYASLSPYRVQVSAGDALYIPTTWWHAVEAIGTHFGATVTLCWATPVFLNDPRLPAVRYFLSRRLHSREAPVAVAQLAWSCLVGLAKARFHKPPFSV